MTTGERIIGEIISSAEQSAEKIIASAEKEAAEIIEKGSEESEKMVSQNIASAEKRAEVIVQNGKSSALLKVRDAMLEYKRSEIRSVIEEAEKKILNFDDDSYFSALALLCEKNSLNGNGKVFLGADSENRNQTIFKEILDKNDSKLEFCGISEKISSGVLITYSDIEINCSIQALIDEKRSMLEDSVNSILFS